MFKKKKKYEINVYRKSTDGSITINAWAYYDVHLDGVLVSTGRGIDTTMAKLFAERDAREHGKLGKYMYSA
jgi:hypothetical protein